MLLADATARLQSMTAWDQDPALTSDEITNLLADYKVVYRVPDLWDLNSAAAEGWRLKAAKAANRFDFGSDVNNFSRDQVYKHCIDMAKHYGSNVVSLDVVGGSGVYDPVLGNVDYVDD